MTTAKQRYHHLDALRAFAMLLGIVLHALLSFVDLPIWPAQDIYQHRAYGIAQHAIHGFRMPLFFLISGFFTAMLWRRRGLTQLVLHRIKRILLPLAVGWVAFVPLIIAVSLVGGIVKENLAEAQRQARNDSSQSAGHSGPDLWTAVRTGDTGSIKAHLAAGTDPDARDGAGLCPLAWAALLGESESAALLLEHGADPRVLDRSGATPLHSAAFLGQVEIAQLLINHGADVNAQTRDGDTPLDSAKTDLGLVEWVAGALNFEVEREEVAAGRKDVIALLEAAGAKSGSGLPGWLGAIVGLWQLGAMIPVFHHLWFLYYLLWLVAGFVVVAWLLGKLQFKPLPSWLIASPTCLLWLAPLTVLPQFFMRQSFGPDTAVGILPWPPKLIYYAIFFGFGAVCFGRPEFEQRGGRWWPLHGLLAIPALLFGLHLFEGRAGNFSSAPLVISLCAALYAWLMIYGCLGFFRRFFSSINKRVRYVSDASYWIYLAHLPLVMGLQILVMSWPFSSFIKFLAICIITYAVLLVLYEFAIRYTIIGTMLNGKKVRVPPLPPKLKTDPTLPPQ